MMGEASRVTYFSGRSEPDLSHRQVCVCSGLRRLLDVTASPVVLPESTWIRGEAALCDFVIPHARFPGLAIIVRVARGGPSEASVAIGHYETVTRSDDFDLAIANTGVPTYFGTEDRQEADVVRLLAAVDEHLNQRLIVMTTTDMGSGRVVVVRVVMPDPGGATMTGRTVWQRRDAWRPPWRPRATAVTAMSFARPEEACIHETTV